MHAVIGSHEEFTDRVHLTGLCTLQHKNVCSHENCNNVAHNNGLCRKDVFGTCICKGCVNAAIEIQGLCASHKRGTCSH